MKTVLRATWLMLLSFSAQAADLPAAADLMKIAFPGWRDNGAGRVQTVKLAGGGKGDGPLAPTRVAIEPKLLVPNSAALVTLIAGMAPVGEDNKPLVAHVTPMSLSAYRFQRTGKGWELAGRQEGFAYEGFFGEARVQAVKLSATVQAIGVETGSCWQGYCGSWLTLYELNQGRVKPASIAGITLAGANIGSAFDCATRLRPLIPSLPQNDERMAEEAPGPHDCYSVKASWSIASSGPQPGDLTVHYIGAISRAAGVPGVPDAIDARQVFRYRGGKYLVISGTDPIPSI